jgi:hypothetical protein
LIEEARNSKDIGINKGQVVTIKFNALIFEKIG